MAQIAPMQGMVAGDFDGDGLPDLYAVQNSFAPIPSVGRADGGVSQLLRGDGHGNFFVVSAAESNLLVPGDAKALSVVDLDHDGWPDFLITRNNDRSLSYRNEGMAGRRMVSVRLSQPGGNPTAIGARVTAEISDGSRQVAEISAGSGYYSQSTASCFFGVGNPRTVQEIRVRWPDGTETTHAASPRDPVITIPRPSR
jgi:hypothetical protein